MKKIYLGIFGLLISGLLTGQQIQVSSLYNMNKYEINPAVAGTEKGIPLALSYRKAWMGIEGSPTEQRLSGHMKILPGMGLGVRLFNGTQGPLRKTGMEATYAYHIPIDRNDSKISFGLSGIFYQYYLDKQSLEVEDPDDLALLGEEQKFLPDAAFGVYYSHHDYYVGASVYQLFQGRVRFDASDIADNRQIRHYFFTGGYNVYINNNFTLEPSLLFKFIESGLWQTDINMSVRYMQSVFFGLSYRSGNAMVIQLGYQGSKINIGYAYDLSLSDINTISTGSHEILFIYRFSSFIKEKPKNFNK